MPPPSFIAVAHAAELPEPVWDPASLEAYARKKAQEYGINETHFVRTLSCESEGFTVVDGQSEVLDAKGPNGREDSWGIAQFHMPSSLETASGREITKEIAQDPAQAIDAAAFNFSTGNARHWSCFNLYY